MFGSDPSGMNSHRSASHNDLAVESDNECEQRPLDGGTGFGDKLIGFGTACHVIAGGLFRYEVTLGTRLRKEVATARRQGYRSCSRRTAAAAPYRRVAVGTA